MTPTTSGRAKASKAQPDRPASNRIDARTKKKVLDYVNAGLSNRHTARELGIDEASVRRIRAAHAEDNPEARSVIFHDKKIGGFYWRDCIPVIEGMQKLRQDSSWGQQVATIEVGNGKTPVAIMFLSDTHIGAMGVDYKLFIELTDIILNTPNLYVAILGDVVEMAIKLRGVAEVCNQALDPAGQKKFMESWIEEIAHKVIFATWGNHETDRTEALAGDCPIKDILARKAPYFPGIGHPDIIVGKETYKMAASHKFKGVTQADCTAGCKKYLREQYNDGEIAVQGDCHRSGISIYNEGGKRRIAMTSSTLNIRSTFAARYFSITTSTAFPVLQLWPDKHMAVPFFTISEWMNSTGTDAPVHKGL